MGLTKQNPAANDAHRVREIDQAGQRVDCEYKGNCGTAQRLIARVSKSNREEFRISLKDYGGAVKAEIRIFELTHEGWKPTPRAVVIGLGAIAGVIAGLCECEARL
ncbi:hypothetical protein [Bradyrhizobium sp. AUGA SZCCT0182]|uniref:hypothetical protein n=1 Tax=Bradyrhizobium sp. AUGA SZCCT0182 TaxID=2807667 RepID=UPI001BA82C23|nr:hypothetical protein [Bradyrhizobium sp. AUGA SZCCT0182]MBR1238185.1 hypothetical protein [Bradyrhizobium sp. AUGA SZCCT0182]